MSPGGDWVKDLRRAARSRCCSAISPRLCSGAAVKDFELWKPPARFAHIGGHKSKTFRLKLAFPFTCFRMTGPIRECRKDQTVAMQIGPNQQRCPADRIKGHDRAFVAQVIEMIATLIAPGVLIEGWAAEVEHAVRLNDVSFRCEQSLDDIGWIEADVDVEPEDP